MSEDRDSDRDKGIYANLWQRLAEYQKHAPPPPPRFDADAYYRNIAAPPPQYHHEDFTASAIGKIAEAGLKQERFRGNDEQAYIELLSRAMAFDMPEYGYLLLGSVGNGKSTMLRLVKAFGQAGRNEFGWRYRTAEQLVQETVDAAGGTPEDPSWETKCFIIDDLGTETVANIYGVKTEALVAVIDARWRWHERGGRTIIAANVSLDGLASRYKERAFSRLKGMFKFVHLKTPDQRGVRE
jgi:DNA replication protein DnaC